MTHRPDLPEALPLFPLSGALLLPRARLPLHVFEPRYLAMLDDVLKTDHRLIGIIQPEGPAPDAGLRRVGCAGRIVSFSETDEGTYIVSLKAVSRFRLRQEEDAFTPYRRGRVDWRDFAADLMQEEQIDPGFKRVDFLKLARRFFDATGQGADWDLLDQASEELLIHAVAMLSPLPSGDKQVLLEAPNLTERRKALIGLMKFALHELRRGEETLQ